MAEVVFDKILGKIREADEGSGGGTSYENLKNKPSVNGVELSGDKTSNELGIYSKPSGGIPESDLSSDVQQALQKHFKGWYASSSALPANPVVGDYAYVKGASSTDPAAIYECITAGSWSDSGRTADSSNVQTFASGEEVNEVHIVNDLTTGGVDDVLSAEQGKKMNTLIHTVFGDTITETIQDEFTAGHGEYTTLVAVNLANQPFILEKNHDTDIIIKKIKLNANSTGNLRIAHVSAEVYKDIKNNSRALSNVSFTQLGIIQIPAIGENIIDVNFNLPEGAHLAIGNMNDSGGVTWMWASTTTDDKQGGIFFGSGGTHNSSKTSHPICVGYEYEYTKTFGYGGGILRETLKSRLKGKKISVLGDSISTFSGYIPSGNASFYPREGNDVTIVTDTWWMKVINAFGASLELNNSWSGSKVTGTESSSGVTRTTALGDNPDIIIVWMGINDFNQEIGIGTWNGTTEMPTSRTTFREAYAIMLNTILTTYPLAKVYCCTLPDIERNSPNTNPPEINEAGVSLKTWNDAIKEVADALCVEVLDLSKCGIHWHNLSTYTSDNVHPNKVGHSILANYIISRLDNAIWKRY